MTATTSPTIDPALPMRDILAVYPGARRALFRQYHVGGCASCGFSEDETLNEICRRNEQMHDVHAVLEYLDTSREEDRAMQVSPSELHDALQQDEEGTVRLLDIRTREEYEAVHIEGSRLFSQELMNTVLMQWPRDTGLIAILDHQGTRSLDAAAYFAGHGFTNVKALLGGIDAWSQEVDPKLPRYRLE